jgi:hypothetical protein
MTSKIKNLFKTSLFLAAIGGMTLFNSCAEESAESSTEPAPAAAPAAEATPAPAAEATPAPIEAAPAPAAADAAPAKTDSMDNAETKPTEPSVKQR